MRLAHDLHPIVDTAAELSGLLVQLDIYRATTLSFMERYDAILCPVNAVPAPLHGASWDQIETYSYTVAYNLTGWPAAVVRGGTSAGGLPIGVLVIARPWGEDVALAVAAYLEGALGGWQAPGI
jgi:amidase